MDLVVLTRDLPEKHLRAGDIGTVVLVDKAGAGYEVEFATLGGHTLAVLTVRAGDVRPVGDHEIAHARAVRVTGSEGHEQRGSVCRVVGD